MLARKIILTVFIIVTGISLSAQGFKAQQLQNGRVNKAYQEKERLVFDLVKYKGLDIQSLNIFIRAFKKEKKMEIWGKDSLHKQYILIAEYRICRTSGKAGPKRKQGDGQIPEGFYHIDRFNPWSSFYLSLELNYPNASDRVLSNKKHPGGEIFIHGSCVTIGCLPMTDDKIEDIYIMAVEAGNNGQENIPVHIFPLKMEGETYLALLEEQGDNGALLEFWSNIEEGYLYFEENKILPEFVLDNNGRYCFR